MQEYRPIFIVATFGFLGLAFYLTYRPRRISTKQSDDGSQAATNPGRSRANIMALNKAILWAVTVIAVVFLFFPQVFAHFAAADDEFTADMDRTVIRIEGIT